MVRGSKNKKQTRPVWAGAPLLSALAAAALAAGFGLSGVRPAQAAGYVYQQHTLSAGVLVNDVNTANSGPASNPAPYSFYVLNNRPDVRPVDLNLINPLAPPTITPAILNRWGSYTLGQTVTPNMAPYWEVSLNGVSDSQMAQYNVLYLRADGISFAPAINEKLRRFVDGGGQLIVEYEGAAKPIGLFTGTDVASATGTTIMLPPAGSALLAHPVVSQPYFLSLSDLTTLSMAAPAYSLTFNSSDSVHKGEFVSLFSPVLVDTAGPVVSAAQIGAGQVVASTLNIGLGVSVHNAATFAQADLYAASTPDLKLLANMLTWSETHPNENKTSHGNASSAGLASFSPAWQYLLTSTTTTTPSAPSGAAVWGNFVFAVDANDVLRAFDAYPAESLLGVAADDGVADYSTGTSYDEIWDTSASQTSYTGASTPTVASFGGTNYVFVEKHDGTVVAFDAVTGTVPTAFTLTAPAPGGSFTGNAPAPTFYDGRLYAGQANGTLHVYDLNEGKSAVVTLDSNTLAAGSSEPVTAAPSVATLTDGDVNVLVAVVPTTLNVYTVLLGGRNEPLSTFNVNGALAGYSISRLNRYQLSNIFADTNYSSLLAYDYSGNVSNTPPSSTAPSAQDPLFAITNSVGYYTDWNMDFLSAGGNTPPTPVNLNFVNASNYGQRGSPTAATAMSAPALDRHGSYYYTETITSSSTTGGVSGTYTNSYLVGVKNAPLYSHVALKFRFRLPTTADGSNWNYLDADGVNYTTLKDYHFVGAPVIDDQDNIYVAATNGTASTSATQATVLCFRGDQPISAVVSPSTSAVDLTQDTITQKDEAGGDDNSIHAGPDTGLGTANPTFGQYLASPPTVDAMGAVTSPSSIQFYNFGLQGPTQRQIVGNLTEPQPLTASPTGGATTSAATLNMQTNLAWFVAPFPVTAASSGANPVAGLTQVGSSLLLTDGTSLYRLSTSPQIGASKVVSSAPSVTPLGISVGTVASVPSVGGSVMAINGTGGIAARTRQVTVIADNNRILGVDGDGSAVWGIDATTRTDTTQIPSVSTKVSFSRPTALSQFAINDYLVADTGNNRCVRFDSAGNVRWELTRFQDPQGLLGAGQPLTLSQPASVIVRPPNFPTTSPLYPGDIGTFYLIADSGNDRIVEVADFVNPSTGALDGNHVLIWASHTGDRYGRSYRYGNAAYYANPATAVSGSGISIAATVTNTRLAPLTASGGLGAVSGDAPGGSLVVFNYPSPPLAFSTAPTAASPANDLVYTTAGFYTASGTGTSTIYTPFTIRSPRFLQLTSSLTASAPVSPNPNNVPAFDFLYADDNGAFDLSYDTTKQAFVAGADRLQFKTSDYQAMSYLIAGNVTTVPAIGVPDTTATTTSTGTTTVYTNLRQNLPFVPTCIQALSQDSQSGMTGTTRRYLITQNYTQGELGSVNSTTTGTAPNTTITNIGKLGGEVFEVDVSYSTSSGTGTTATPGGFGNSTLSHPALTGPLTQPTYAVRLP